MVHNWSSTSMLESFTGVVEALVVLVCVSVFTFRVLRRFGLDVPCSSRSRFRKHLMLSTDVSTGLKENYRSDYCDRSLNKAALEGSAELSTQGGLVDTVSGLLSERSMADSRHEPGGNDSQSCYSSSTEDAKGQEQEDLDKDQDCKDKELYEALQAERETLALLYSELEQERNCAASAASEALAMISRLQEEKAAVELEARQFQRMVVEKALYDQEAIEALNELLVSREEEKLALEEEIRVCRERLDCVVSEERRHSLVPKAIGAESRIVLNSEQPVFIKNEKVNATSRVEESQCVDKFSTTKSQLFTALVQDGGCDTEAEVEVKAQIGPRSITMPNCRFNGPQVPTGNIRRKVGKSDDRDEDIRFSRWGQDVAQKTLDQINQDRRIEERRLSVLEYVWKFEQQQREQGIRLPVQMSRPKSAGKSRSKSRGSDVNEITDSPRNDECTLRVLTSDDPSQRRLIEEKHSGEEHFGEEQSSIGSSSSEAEDGGRCEDRPSCIGLNDDDLRDGEVCKGIDGTGGCAEEALFVHDVYEVQKSPYDVAGPVTGDAGSLHSLADAEVQQRTPSDRLDKPDLQTFERDCESDQETKCLIHPSHLHEEVEDSETDSQWEDLHGRVRYKNLRISSLLRMDNSRSGVEEEVEQLTHRLKALEADRYLMKQTIESLRRENEEMKLLQDLVQQLWELRGSEQQDLWPRTRMPSTLQFQNLMSFTGLRTAQAYINKVAQACLQRTDSTALQEERSVGLGRLLQHSPEGLPGTCLTRVRRVEELIPSTTLFLNKEK